MIPAQIIKKTKFGQGLYHRMRGLLEDMSPATKVVARFERQQTPEQLCHVERWGAPKKGWSRISLALNPGHGILVRRRPIRWRMRHMQGHEDDRGSPGRNDLVRR